MTQRYREKEEVQVVEFVKHCEKFLLKLLTLGVTELQFLTLSIVLNALKSLVS
jgi:hypothetical protein